MEDEKTKISMLQYKAFCNKEAALISSMDTEALQSRLFELDRSLQELRAYYQTTFRELQDRTKKASAELREKLREADKKYVNEPRVGEQKQTEVSRKQEQAIKSMMKLGISREKAYDTVVNMILKK